MVPKEVTLKLVEALTGVDHVGTLLRVDDEVARLLENGERKDEPLLAYRARKHRLQVLDRLTDFLDEHAAEANLGLRLEGEQVEAGMRFLSIARKDTYDIVVGNPPYQGTSKMAEAAWFKKHYLRGKDNLYACFLERGLELAKPGGLSALLTMRGSMFLGQFRTLREYLLKTWEFRAIGDFDRGAFDDVPNEVLAVALSVFSKRCPTGTPAVATQPTASEDTSYDRERTRRKRAAVLAQVGRYEFDVAKLAGIEGAPFVYWWSENQVNFYTRHAIVGTTCPAEAGIITGDDGRFTRRVHEVATGPNARHAWPYFVQGAKGLAWFEPAQWVINWNQNGLRLKAFGEVSRSPRFGNPKHYNKIGIAFSMIGSEFRARVHRFPSYIGKKGSSMFPETGQVSKYVCMLNSRRAREIIASLSPGLDFQNADVNRLPAFEVAGSNVIFPTLESAFAKHERCREPSVEFEIPRPVPLARRRSMGPTRCQPPRRRSTPTLRTRTRPSRSRRLHLLRGRRRPRSLRCER